MDHPFIKRILSVFISPFFLALPITIAGFFLLPDIFGKYRSEIVESGMIDKKEGFEYFEDINRDGQSERIIVFNNTEGRASVKILSPLGDICNQYYFSGQILPSYQAFKTGPVDNKGQKVLILLTIRNDSVLLHGILPETSNPELIRDLFITRVSKNNNQFDYYIPNILLCDVNRDCTNEVILGILAGFSLQPRSVYVYDIKKRQLLQSPEMGTFFSVTDTVDLNRDGFTELLTYSYATGNYSDQSKITSFDDQSAWLLTFNHQLKFLFTPVQFKGQYNTLITKAYYTSGQPYIAALFYPKQLGGGPPMLMLFNAAGKLVKKRIVGDTLKVRLFNLYVSGTKRERLWLIREDGIIEEYDQNLNRVQEKHIEALTTTGFILRDLDHDGSDEIIFPSGGQKKLIITRSDFSHPVQVSLLSESHDMHYGVRQRTDKNNELFIQSGQTYMLYTYFSNLWYYMRVPVYLALYLISLCFIILIQYIQRRTLQQKYDVEKKISEMQLLLLSNQLDPHFTFNAINSISASILLGKPEEANNSLLSLSRLMRSCVLQADKTSRSLAEELDFLRNYIDLVRGRMNRSFEYTIEVADNVDLSWQVPKMITEIHTENAIKHGLKPMENGGVLIICVKQEFEHIILEIEDNGVGRKQAGMNHSQGTGKGVQIMEQTIALFNRYNQKEIRSAVYDLTDELGNPAGTRVRISLPIGMNYSLYRK